MSRWVGESGSQKSDVSLKQKERLPAAKELGKTSLMFLVHPTLGEKEMKETVRIVREVMLGQKKMLECWDACPVEPGTL